MIVIGAAALIFFGPDQLPKVARRAGQVMREVQNTSQGFIREMERAADDIDFRERAAAARVSGAPVSSVPEAAAAWVPGPPAAEPHEAPPPAPEA